LIIQGAINNSAIPLIRESDFYFLLPVILNFLFCHFMLGYNQQSLNKPSLLKIEVLASIHINTVGMSNDTKSYGSVSFEMGYI